MSGTIASWATLIHLSEDRRGLETGLGLGVDRFLDYLFRALYRVVPSEL